jgi:hypothetical protein
MTERRTAIIFVPGIRPKPPAELHTEQLGRCLYLGVKRAGGSSEVAEQLAAGFKVVGWSQQFYGEHADIAVDLPGIERLLADQGSAAEDAREARSLGQRTGSVLYALADRFPLLTNMFATRRMETRLQEMNRYFADLDGNATAARAMVAEALQIAWNNGERTVLIGHSFGSVIAYDTLWELCRLEGNPGMVDMFVTMGSPLTMSYIRERLKGAHAQLDERFPVNIRHWVNLAALGEATAQDRKLADCFAQMISSGAVGQISDNLELLNQYRGPDGLNVHKCYGYLASPLTGALLLAGQNAGS